MYIRCSVYVTLGLHPDRRRRRRPEIELLMNPTAMLSAAYESSLPYLLLYI